MVPTSHTGTCDCCCMSLGVALRWALLVQHLIELPLDTALGSFKYPAPLSTLSFCPQEMAFHQTLDSERQPRTALRDKQLLLDGCSLQCECSLVKQYSGCGCLCCAETYRLIKDRSASVHLVLDPDIDFFKYSGVCVPRCNRSQPHSNPLCLRKHLATCFANLSPRQDHSYSPA